MEDTKKKIKNPVIRFVHESYGELKKVVWPKRSEAIAMTVSVVMTIVISAALLAALDYGLSQGMKALLALR